MKIIQLALLASLALGVAVGQAAVAPPVPPTNASSSPLGGLGGLVNTQGPFSVVLAVGSPTQPPRHAAMAVGVAEAVSATQDFFLTIALEPKPGGVTGNQESILLGMTQQLGSMTFLGMKFDGWGSAAFGTSLANAAKINLVGTPATIVASASTSSSFTAQYVVGFAYKLSANWSGGPIAKYTHIVGQPSITEAGIYLKWSPKK